MELLQDICQCNLGSCIPCIYMFDLDVCNIYWYSFVLLIDCQMLPLHIVLPIILFHFALLFLIISSKLFVFVGVFCFWLHTHPTIHKYHSTYGQFDPIQYGLSPLEIQ
jgi:hypothetical protein